MIARRADAPTGEEMNRADLPAWIAAGLVLCKLVYLGFPNLFPEEAYYWLYARHLDIGYLDHPPMVAWLIALGTAVFGDTEFGVRIFAVACSLVTSFFVYRLTALLHDRRAAAYALLAVQVLPYYFLCGLVMTPDAPLTACWAGMLYWLACAIFERRAWAWLGVGVCLGFGMLSKYTIALLGPATLLFLALDPGSRFWFRRAAPYLGVALAVVIFTPVLWWNHVHHWASFAFQTTGRTRARRRFSLHELLGSILVVLTPVGIWLAAEVLTGKQRSTPEADGGQELAARRRWLFTRTFTLVPLSVFVLFSLTHHVKLNWTGPLWLAVIPAVAARIAAFSAASALESRRTRYLQHGWNATVMVFALGYVLVLHHLAFGLPGVKYPRNIELMPVGWSDLAKQIEQQKDELERIHPKPVYVVGMDRNFIASELSFYQANQPSALRETLGVHLFESTSLMYSYWFPPEHFQGATLLLVGFQKSQLISKHIRDHSTADGIIQAHTLSHRGKFVRQFYTRVVSEYHVGDVPKAP